MKGFVQIAVTAALVAGAAAEIGGHGHVHRHRAVDVPAHQHQHLHAKRADAPAKVVKRADAVAVETKYVYSDGEAVAADEAKECIAAGECIVVGTSKPTTTAEPTTTKQAAEFFQSSASSSIVSSSSSFSSSTSSTISSTTTSSSTSTSTSTTSTSTSTSTTSTAAAATSTAASNSTSTASGDFPSGSILCSEFPSAYGAEAVSWVGLDGWASIQTTGSWTPGVDISDIVEPTSGGCVSGSFCSYACAPGQSKAQWPTTSQGSTGQSIGGLWCNDDGYLELTNPDFTTLCQDGLGGITIENQLSDVACVCGTNYPGNEMMNIPLVTEPGGSYSLTNINAKTAYQWEGKYTSGQFYVNNLGVSVEQACVWTSTDYPDSAGNWAPVNIGAGTDIYGITYLSIFPNSPTSTAELDFDIEITGDVTSECWLKSGAYYGGSTTGCTTAITTGGSVTIVFKASS